MLKNKIAKILTEATGVQNIPMMTPGHSKFGDVAINIHQIQAQKPDVTAEDVAEALRANDLFEKVDVVGAFVNLFISKKVLFEEWNDILEKSAARNNESVYQDKTVIVEYAHPNTLKTFHIGHLRNISLGEAISRILSSSGAIVYKANYQGDVGLHIAKCLYILKRDNVDYSSKSLEEKIKLVGKAYADGNTAYETDETAKAEIHTINKQIYEKDPSIMNLWNETRQWSLDYFDNIYNRVDTKFDRLFFESEIAERGLAVAHEAFAKGILTKSDGAIVLDGEKYGVDTRVFINSLGLPTYEGKELGLAELEFSEFGNIDKCIHVVGPEQKSFFETTFKVEELLDPEKYGGKQQHFAYGFVDLKDGKMSSRKGNVMSGVGLLDDVKANIREVFKVEDDVAEVIAIAAVKYSFLKVEAQKKIMFDVNESISIHGNSGPYLLYVYARIQSLLSSADVASEIKHNENLTTEDDALLRLLPRFQEAVFESAQSLSPHVISNYLFSLAQTFNTLYEKRSFQNEPDEELKKVRYGIAKTTADTIKNGLHLLGIQVLKKI